MVLAGAVRDALDRTGDSSARPHLIQMQSHSLEAGSSLACT